MTGLGINSSSPEDEQLLTAIRAAADLCLADAADGPAARGGGARTVVSHGGERGRQGAESPVERLYVEGGKAGTTVVAEEEEEEEEVAEDDSRVGGSRLVVSPGDPSPLSAEEEREADVSAPRTLFSGDASAENDGGGGGGGSGGSSLREPERPPRDTVHRDDSPLGVFLGGGGVRSGGARYELEKDSSSSSSSGGGGGGGSRSSPMWEAGANSAPGGQRSRLFPPVAPLDSEPAAGKGTAAAALSFSSSSNVAAELKDAIISPVTDMIGSGIGGGGGGSGSGSGMYGSGISASGSGGGFSSSTFSPIPPKNFRAAGGDSGGIGIFSVGLDDESSGPAARQAAEEAALAAVVAAAAGGGNNDDGGGGGGGVGGGGEMGVNGDGVREPRVGSSGGVMEGDRRKAHVDDAGDGRVIGWDVPSNRAAAAGLDNNGGDDDDDDDTHSLASSSVISVSSAPGNPCSRPSSLGGSSCAVAAECPPRACSDPLSPQGGGGGGGGGHSVVSGGRSSRRLSGFGAAEAASGAPSSLQRQRALSVPTSLASIAAASVTAASRAGGGDGVVDGRVERTPVEEVAAGGGTVEGAEGTGLPDRRTAVLRVIDARPMISAKGHLLMGKGHEVGSLSGVGAAVLFSLS